MNQKAGAVIFAKNPKLVTAFYRELFSMDETHAEPGLIVLESESLQIIIHGLPKHIAESINIVTPPEPRDDTAIKLVFPVVGISDVRKRALALGGSVKDESNEFVARGFRACDGIDPEGNVIQFREDAD